jgi:hypothetical protein
VLLPAGIALALMCPPALAERTARDEGAAVADFDGDRKADLALKFDGGTWRIDYAANGFGAWDWSSGVYGDFRWQPVPADYDGDGKADLAVKTDTGEWLIDYARDGFGTWSPTVYRGYGGPDAHPVPADYDGDGKADLAIKSDGGGWFIDYAADGFGAWNAIYSGYGGPDAHPVPADYDGDRRADLSIKSDGGGWYIDYAADGFGRWNAIYTGYGWPDAHPVPADYDGDRRADLAIKSDGGQWFIDYASDGFGRWNAIYSGYGAETARALPADFDGDGKADLAVKEDCGRYYIDLAAGGFGAWNLQAADASMYDNQRTVTTAAELKDALTSDYVGSVWVAPPGGVIDLSGETNLPLRSCVWVRGRRERLLAAPVVTTSDVSEQYRLFNVEGNRVRVEGLDLMGPAAGRRDGIPLVTLMGVSVDGANHRGFDLVVTNNEIHEWSGAGVRVDGQVFVTDPADVPPGTPLLTKDTPGIPWVWGNYIHDNARDQGGYGVETFYGGYVRIEANVFDYNRHAVASGGTPHTGYLAFHNMVLQGGYPESGALFDFYNQHFDVHGTGDGGYGGGAGEYYEIAYNTIRGEQDYHLGLSTRPAFMLRGQPAVGAFFHDNVVVHDDIDEAISLKMAWDDLVAGPHFYASGNEFDAERSTDIGVGDFDGDGRDDLLLATGRQWFYSSGGKTEWRFLMAAADRIGNLRFGEFDGLPGTDVFVKDGNRWLFASAGRVWWQQINTDSTPLGDLLFGDFDGDGRTDVFKADGTAWYISYGARGPWVRVISSPFRAASLRVGDFDGDGHADVFGVWGGYWVYYRDAQSPWTRLGVALSTDLAGLVLRDFDGDGRTDVARGGSVWQYASGGQGGWLTLTTPPAPYRSFNEVFFGNFTADRRCDAVRFEMAITAFPGSAPITVIGPNLVAWRGLGATDWVRHSWHEMR